MEAHQCVEFTCVELAASVENAATGPMEKAVAGHSGGEGRPCAGEGRGGQVTWWRERERRVAAAGKRRHGER
jgi:hypothetical protein